MKNIEFLKNNLIIHRGVYNSRVIENTLTAFSNCVDKNYAIELDIHILTDKTIVVFHDYNLFRMCKNNKIIETLSYEQLSKIKVKNKYTIPTLKQVMHIVNGKVPIIIEVKDLNTNSNFEEELVKLLDNYNGPFAIHSVNPFVIDWFHKNRKNYVIGLIIFNELDYKILKKYIKKVDFLSVNKKNLPFKYNFKNKLIIGWTITSDKEYKKYREVSDNLICENIL